MVSSAVLNSIEMRGITLPVGPANADLAIIWIKFCFKVLKEQDESSALVIIANLRVKYANYTHVSDDVLATH